MVRDPLGPQVVPHLAVSQILADAMADLGLAFPPPPVNLADIKRKYHAAVQASEGAKKQKAARKADLRERPRFERSARTQARSEIPSGPPKQNKVCRVGSQGPGGLGILFGRKVEGR